MSWPARRAALRIARRSAQQNPGRSLLVVGMIALPVLALTAADVVFRTAQLPRAEVARREIGSADLRVERVASGPIEQHSLHSWGEAAPAQPSGHTAPSAPAPLTERELLGLLPAGSRVTPSLVQGRAVVVRTPTGVTEVALLELQLQDPLTTGLLHLERGRRPRTVDEVLVSPRLLRRTGLDVGELLRVADARELRVVGTASDPSSLSRQFVVGLPGAVPPQASGSAPSPAPSSWLVGLPAGVHDLGVVPQLNRAGIYAHPRSWILEPPPAKVDPSVRAEVVGVAVVAVGLAALEVILLAGAAFAVGARRQRRDLALVAASGGDAAHVRGIVLAGGAVLGLVGAVVGVLGGVAVAALLRPRFEMLTDGRFGPFDVRPAEVLAVAVLGVATGLLAAALPARAAARRHVVDGLTGRRGEVRSGRRTPVAGLLVAATGAALAFYAAGTGRAASAATSFNLVLTGAVLAQLGFVLCAPALVGLAGRVAGFLPLPLRLAVRDAARHRARSGPAVAAVMAALAGSVAVSVYFVSDTERQRRAYDPQLRPGQVMLYGESLQPDAPAGLVARVRATLPVRSVLTMRFLQPDCQPAECRTVDVLRAPAFRCPAEPSPPATKQEALIRTQRDLRCRGAQFAAVAVGDSATVRAVAGAAASHVERALSAGGAVVLDHRLLDAGHVTFRVVTEGNGVTPTTRDLRIPAVLQPAEHAAALPQVVVSAAAARLLGVPAPVRGVLLDTTRPPTEAEEDRALAIIRDQPAGLMVERGFRRDSAVPLLVLLAASTLVTLGATAVATGLAAAEGRPDLATLAAVGGSPRLRRVLAMAQAATIAVLGAALGVVAGLVPAVAVVSARAEYPLVIPWPTLLACLGVVPLIAAGCAGLLTRSRLPIERRIA